VRGDRTTASPDREDSESSVEPWCLRVWNVKLTLERSFQEANDLRHKFIRPEHLLLGLLREEDTDEWRTLQKVGITLREVRRVMSGEPDLGSAEDATGPD